MKAPKVGECYCCAEPTKGHLKRGHDARALSMLNFLPTAATPPP
jgi:hypothetical protein